MKDGAPPPGDVAAGVLICDDDDAMRELLGVIIATSGSLRVVGEAVDGNEAIAAAALLRPDVILLDLAMPNRDGLEALPELREVAPEAQIVVFSGFASAIVLAQVIALGATSYLEKGADPDTILATIREALTALPELPADLGTTG